MRAIRWAAAAACMAAGSAALAQPASSLALYGIVDISVRRHTGLAANNARAAGDTLSVSSGVGPASRWGLRGSEDLGGGLRAFFNLESGMAADSGSQSNPATYFERASVVGLSGRWGTLAAGRQNTLVADSAVVADPIGMRFANLNPNILVTSLSSHLLGYELGAAASATQSNRVNNGIKYSVPFGPVAARAMFSFGEASGDATRQSTSGAGLDYISTDFSATSAYTSLRDATGREVKSANAGASWRALPALRVMANASYSRAETSPTALSRSRLLAAGANYAATPTVDVLAGFYKVARSRTALADDGFNRLLVFVEYKFSRRNKVFLEIDGTRWKGDYQAVGKSTSTGLSVGLTHAF